MPGDPDGRLTAAPHLCRHCGNSGLLYVLREYSEEEDASGGDTAWRTWELVRCPPYGGISLLFSQGTEHEVQGILEEGGSPELILTDTVYPPGELHPKGLPEEVASALEAAERVKPIDFNGYAVLLGRVIERVCADRDARGDNLFEKLKNLEEKGEIPPKLVRVASQFRRMRNIGAHADLASFRRARRTSSRTSVVPSWRASTPFPTWRSWRRTERHPSDDRVNAASTRARSSGM